MDEQDIDVLCPELRRQAKVMQGSADLPSRFAWSPDAEVKDLSEDPSPMSRFADGYFTITIAGQMWTVDGGVNKQGFPVSWKLMVAPETGEISARPVMTTSWGKKGPKPEELLVAMAINARPIGSLGRLAWIWPDTAEANAIFDELNLKRPHVLVPADRLIEMRTALILSLNE